MMMRHAISSLVLLCVTAFVGLAASLVATQMLLTLANAYDPSCHWRAGEEEENLVALPFCFVLDVVTSDATGATLKSCQFWMAWLLYPTALLSRGLIVVIRWIPSLL